ncbi:unnamed protein product [Hydatigera taeniaeformis]|uniref:Secreted protein n=1 Tax=Hydatigena taeniaeformis TaxID=6205 RepID=A0A0R3XA80_HYDTA|nr:unnamed protein product [Hydatigera taeniaeformis]
MDIAMTHAHGTFALVLLSAKLNMRSAGILILSTNLPQVPGHMSLLPTPPLPVALPVNVHAVSLLFSRPPAFVCGYAYKSAILWSRSSVLATSVIDFESSASAFWVTHQWTG